MRWCVGLELPGGLGFQFRHVGIGSLFVSGRRGGFLFGQVFERVKRNATAAATDFSGRHF